MYASESPRNHNCFDHHFRYFQYNHHVVAVPLYSSDPTISSIVRTSRFSYLVVTTRRIRETIHLSHPTVSSNGGITPLRYSTPLFPVNEGNLVSSCHENHTPPGSSISSIRFFINRTRTIVSSINPARQNRQPSSGEWSQTGRNTPSPLFPVKNRARVGTFTERTINNGKVYIDGGKASP